MHFIFITRCYRPTNIAQIQQNLREVFRNTEHTYRQFLLIDLTHGESVLDFYQFADDKTTLHLVTEKPAIDTQATEGMDKALDTVKPDDNVYVYVLDDDNIVHPDFLHVADYCHGEDAVVFKIAGKPYLGNKAILTSRCPIGHIDWANYVTKLTTMQRIKVYKPDGPRRCEDGVFFDHMKRNNCTLVFVDKVMAYYNKLSKP